MCCPLHAPPMEIDGRPGPGSCAASAATWFPAIRPSATACRWSRSPGFPPPIIPSFMRPIRRRASPLCRRTRRFDGRSADAGPAQPVPPRPVPLPRLNGRRCPRNPPPASRAPRCAPSRATACCTFSCRRPGELEHYVELVAAVEARGRSPGPAHHPRRLRAAERSAHRQFQRHAGSGRDRGQHSSVRQLGVNWRSRTAFLYEAARECRLTTEKFMLDGRHTGTGGGNHIVLGGASAADSPFLRRPDLLRSLLGYWHNHPSLSYLFSRACSSAPLRRRRASMRRATIRCTSWRSPSASSRRRVRARRRGWSTGCCAILLIDVTGNTHRTEFCIDKLYSPDGPTGRLGLLEMRAFEMPPHARMSLTQQLLLRAMVARFWRKPYAPAKLGALGHGAARSLPDAVFRRSRLRRRARGDARRRVLRSSRIGSRRISNSAFRSTAISRCAACSWSCARRSNPGMSWARRARPAARCATWIPRWSGCR